MDGLQRRLPAGIYGLALLCFLLPFVAVSCQGERVATFTGVHLVTGTMVSQQRGKPERVPAEPFAILASLAGIAAIGFTFKRGQLREGVLGAVAGVTGFLALLALKFKIDDEIQRKGDGMFQVAYEPGYWLTLILFICGSALNFRIYRQEARSESAGQERHGKSE